MVTILDVAAYANVSKSTVSLVLNKSPLVKPETSRRVEEAMKDLGYIPSNSARGLRKRSTKCLGVIIAIESKSTQTYEYNYETGLYSYNITNGIPDGLHNTDYGLITERYCASEAGGELPQAIRNGQIDGLFLVGGLFNNQLIEDILNKGLPVVAVGRYYEQIDSVSVDVEQGTYLEVEHLLQAGHRKIAYINCPQIYHSSAERLLGMQRACNSYAARLDESWTVHCQQNTGEGGYEAMKQLFEEGIRPDAIATANEPIALGVMRYLYEKGIRIPDDVSLVAYEDSVLGGYASPALTSVNIFKERMGAMAARMLLKRIENADTRIETQIIQPQLVLRDSVKLK